jgi:hypothetical protein
VIKNGSSAGIVVEIQGALFISCGSLDEEIVHDGRKVENQSTFIISGAII